MLNNLQNLLLNNQNKSQSLTQSPNASLLSLLGQAPQPQLTQSDNSLSFIKQLLNQSQNEPNTSESQAQKSPTQSLTTDQILKKIKTEHDATTQNPNNSGLLQNLLNQQSQFQLDLGSLTGQSNGIGDLLKGLGSVNTLAGLLQGPQNQGNMLNSTLLNLLNQGGNTQNPFGNLLQNNAAPNLLSTLTQLNSGLLGSNSSSLSNNNLLSIELLKKNLLNNLTKRRSSEIETADSHLRSPNKKKNEKKKRSRLEGKSEEYFQRLSEINRLKRLNSKPLKLPYPYKEKIEDDQWQPESYDSIGFQQLVENAKAVLGVEIQERGKLFYILERNKWHKKKVINNLKKNRPYYRVYFNADYKPPEDEKITAPVDPAGSIKDTPVKDEKETSSELPVEETKTAGDENKTTAEENKSSEGNSIDELEDDIKSPVEAAEDINDQEIKL